MTSTPGNNNPALDPAAIAQLAVKYRTLLLILLGVLMYVLFLGLRDVWYPDEPDIGEVTRAMFLSGDWIHPRRMGEIWVDYPPMVYWIGTVSSHLLGGMSAFALRLPNALAAIATVVLISMTLSRWYDARTGLWGGFALLTFLLFVYEANSYRPDVTFTLATTGAMILYAEGAIERTNLLLKIAAFACLGIAMLAKGPLGLLLPGLVLTLWHGARREWLSILLLAPLSLVAIGIYLPWFVATAEGMGWGSMVYEFYAQNFERFLTGEHRGHAQPWYYFLRNFWLDFTPWSWLFPPAIWWLFRSGRYRDPRIQLALWWFGAFFVFLSIAATKRQLYLLPAFPAVAMCLAPWLASIGDTAKQDDAPGPRPVHIVTAAMSALFAALGVAIFVLLARIDAVVAAEDFTEEELQVVASIPLPLAILGGVLLASSVWLFLAWRRRDARASLVRIGASHVALYVVILSIVMPAFEPSKTYRPQSQWISDTIGDETHFGMVDDHGVARRGGFAYYTGTQVPLLETTAEVEAFFREHPTSIVLIKNHLVDGIFAGDDENWNARVLRELRVGRHHYTVVRAPLTE